MNLNQLEQKKAELEAEKAQLTSQITNLESKARELSATEVLDGENLSSDIEAVTRKLRKKEDKLKRLDFASVELAKRIEVADKADKESQLQNLMLQYSNLGSTGKKLSTKFQRLSGQLIQTRTEINELSQEQQAIKKKGQTLAKQLSLSFVLPKGKIIPPGRSELEQARKALG